MQYEITNNEPGLYNNQVSSWGGLFLIEFKTQIISKDWYLAIDYGGIEESGQFAAVSPPEPFTTPILNIRIGFNFEIKKSFYYNY